MASLSITGVVGDLKQRYSNSRLTSVDSGLSMERFEPRSRRNSMLASLRFLSNSTVSERFESRRRGSQDAAANRRKSDPRPRGPEADGAAPTPRHQRSRRNSLQGSTLSNAAPLEKRTRKRKNLSVPDILEDGTEESASQTSVGTRRRTLSLTGRDGAVPEEEPGGSKTHSGVETKGGLLATGNLAKSFRTRLQQARKLRRKELLLKFKSYSRLIIFLIRLCKNHFLSVDDSGHSHRGKYFKDGEEEELLFDVRYFRANKEAGISQECKKILSLPSHQRTKKEEYRALIALRNFPTFAEFPLGMQQEIVKVGWYEKYQAQRVILRQGHRPLNFYFIMTGSVIVRVLEEGSDTPRTVVYLNRGETFGELGLVNRERRKSTVISREKVELLCIADADYTRIFMAGGLQTLLDPNQSDFIRNLTFLERWPMHLLAENPKKCVFSYFKRGEVLVKNSKKSDWILVVKSGSCSVMKLLHNKKTKKKKRRKKSQTGMLDLTTEGKRYSLRGGSLESYQQRKTRDEFEHFMRDLNIHEEELANQLEPSSESKSTAHGQMEGQLLQNDRNTNAESNNPGVRRTVDKRSGRPVLPTQNPNVHLSRLPSYVATSGQLVSSGKESADNSQREANDKDPVGQRKTVATEIVDEVVKKEDDDFEAVWVQVQILVKGSYFGLSDMLFDAQPSFSVVSNGAECILMSKKFYREHATSRMLTRLRREEQCYPDDQELQKNLENKLQWELYKRKRLLTALKQTRKHRNQQR